MSDLMLPLLLLILAGVLAHRWLQVEAKPLAKLTLYVLSPALIFNSLYNSQLTGDQLLRLGGGTLLFICSLSLLLTICARCLGLSVRLTSAMQLGSVFMNVGNYGLPIIAGIFGPVGLERGAVVMVVHQMLMFSLAIYFAARSSLSVGQSVKKILQMPTAYAAILALTLRRLPLALPSWLFKAITLLTQASIPIFLLLLGVQLAGMSFCRRWPLLGLGTFFKLGLAPLLADRVAHALQFDLLSRQAFILSAATPTAVVTTMLSVEFDAEPELVSSLTIITTLASILTIPLVIRWLGLG
ncbi:MAG: AEC family transporter [Firmicutes bacterium]|nr:AEC family transporter [Bacillota bacterium]